MNDKPIFFKLRHFLLVTVLLSGMVGFSFAQPPVCPTGATLIKSHTDVTCFGANDGTITVELSDGNSPLNFELYDLIAGQFVTMLVTETNDPDGNGNFRKVRYSGLYPSSFTVVVLKAGCLAKSISETPFGFVVNEPAALSATGVATTDCNPALGTGTGTINVTVSGGTTPYTYLWGDGNTSQNRTAMDAGNYSLTITDKNLCTFVLNVTVPGITQANAGPAQTVCVANATLAANTPAVTETGTWSVVSGTGTFGNPNSPSSTVTGLSAGVNTFRWAIQDAGLTCSTTSDVNITFVNLVLTPTPNVNLLCFGNTNGSGSFTATGGSAYTFTVDANTTGGTTSIVGNVLSFSNAGAGLITVTVTDVSGCSKQATITVTQPAAIAINTTASTNVACNGASTGSITVTATGGTAPYSFTLNPIGTTNATGNFTNLAAGTYTVSVTDVNACTPAVTGNIVITQPTAITVNTPVKTDVTCFGGNDGTVTVTASGGTGTLTYTLNPGGTSNTTGIFSGLTANTYSVTVTDANACTALSTNVTVVQPPAIVINTTANTNVTCNGGSNGSVTVTASGGTGALTYTLNPGGVSNGTGNFINLIAGTYTVTVTDTKLCTLTSGNIIVTQPAAIAINTTASTNVACNGASTGSITVTATGGTTPYSFTLSPGAVINATGNFVNLNAGTYTVSVTDANGCTPAVTGNITITEPLAITVNAPVKTDVSCNGGSDGTLTVTASGGTGTLTYTLSPGGTNNTTGIFSGLAANTYSVTVTDANACTALSANVTVVQPPAIVINTTANTNVTCNGGNNGSVTVTASGGTGALTYTLNPGGASNGTGNFTNLLAGTYTVTVTDTKLCTLTSGNIIVTQPAAIAINTTASSNVACNGASTGSITVTATGGTTPYAYTLNPIGTTNATGSFTNLAAGTYTVSVTDLNGCTPAVTGNIVITQPTAITVNVTVKTDVTCFGGNDGTVTVTASGGTGTLTYTLSPGGTNNTTGNFTGLTANTYSVTVTDANACTALSANVTVAQPAAIVINTTANTNVTCNGGNNGSVTVTASGGTGALTYTLNPGGVSNGTGNFINLIAGTYTVSVTDANNCGPITSANIIISDPLPITVNSPSKTDITCNGANNGSITVIAAGGTAPYTYTINPGGISNGIGNFTNLSVGTYTVSVTDVNGCTPAVTGNITISEPLVIAVGTTTSTNVTCNGGNTGTITVTAVGGTAPYAYTLNPGGTNNGTGSFNNLIAGTYTVSVTDVNGCAPAVTGNIIITEPLAITVNAPVKTEVTCTGGADGTLTVSASGGTGTLTYTLNPGGIINTTGNFTGLSANTYTVSVTDANNCGPVTSASMVITQPTAITQTTLSTNISCNGLSDGTISVSASGGTGALNYLLTPGGITNASGNFSGLAAGSYTVTISDANSCSIISNVTLTQPVAVTATLTGTTSICNGTTTNLTVVFTGTPPFQFQYSDGVTTSAIVPSFFNTITIPVTPTATTTYTLVSVKDALNCTGTVSGSAVITVNQPPSTGNAVGVSISPVCTGGSSDITVALSQIGVSYQLRNNANNNLLGAAVTGTGGTISLPTGPLVATTTFNVLATSAGCPPSQLASLATVNVAGTINAALGVTAVNPTVCSGSATNIRVAASETGVSYQLRDNANVNIGAPVAGTGGDIDLPTGNLTVNTTFNILASNGTCSVVLTAQPTVNVDLSPNLTLAVSVSLTPLCSGGNTNVIVDNSENGVSYQLRDDSNNNLIGAPVAGTGGNISLPTGNLAVTTTFNVLATGGATCTPVQLTNKATVTVSGSINATLAVVAVNSPICNGSSTFIQITGSEAGVNYQLRDNANVNIGAPVAGTGGNIDLPTGNLTNNTIFNVLASNGTCSIVLTNLATVNIDLNPDPALAVSATITPLCTGGSSNISIALSQIGVSYQLRDALNNNIGAQVSGTGGTILLPTGPLAATTTFNVLATGGASCPSVQLTATVTVTVSGSIDASLVTTSSPSVVCSGSSASIQVEASVVGVNYQLFNSATNTNIGLPVSGTGNTLNFSTGNLATTTTFYIMASNGTCSIALTNTQTITVNPSPNVAIAVTANPNTICSGASSSIDLATSDVGASYELQLTSNSTVVGASLTGTGASLSFLTGSLTATESYKVMATMGTCVAQLTNTATVTVRPVGDPLCTGGTGTCATVIITPVPSPATCANSDGSILFNVNPQVPLVNNTGVRIDINGPVQRTNFNSFTFNNLPAGLYNYTIEYGDPSCIKTGTVTIDKSGSVGTPTASEVVSPVCFGDLTGSARISVTQPVDITGQALQWSLTPADPASWKDFTAGGVISGLPAGPAPNYEQVISVRKTAADLCNAGVLIVIPNANPKITATFVTAAATCNGADGAITVNASGGTGTYLFSINGGQSYQPSNVFSGLSGGGYTVLIKDNLGCAQSYPIDVTFPGFINHQVTGTNADCTNNGNSGFVTVSINDLGVFQVALSTDPTVIPPAQDFKDYTNNQPFTFTNVSKGQYYVYIKSSGFACPTRSAPIDVFGVYPVSFTIEPRCSGNQLSMGLANLSGEPGSPFTVEVFNKLGGQLVSSTVFSSIPITGSVELPFSTNAFLQSIGEYQVRIVQFQTIAFCTVTSALVDHRTIPSLNAQIGYTLLSYPDIATGKLNIRNVTGGLIDYTSQIVLDSASIQGQQFASGPDIVPTNPDLKYEITYSNIPAGRYVIIVSDSNGCSLQLTARVPLDTRIMIPNVFTPNGDGINDVFYIRNLPSTSKIQITNRWGNPVFSSEDYKNDWAGDGIESGMYFYRLLAPGGNPIVGWVEILRSQKP